MGGFCHIWGQQRYIWVLSNMGLGFVKYGVHSKVNLLVLHRPCRAARSFILGFVKYGLSFVTYGEKKDSFGFCHIWVGFVTYGVSKDTFGFRQIWVGFCHLWGQKRYTRDLSNMAWVLSLMG